VYDNDKKTIKYDFTVLGNSTTSGIPMVYGEIGFDNRCFVSLDKT
jgi:hypothetical protein